MLMRLSLINVAVAAASKLVSSHRDRELGLTFLPFSSYSYYQVGESLSFSLIRKFFLDRCAIIFTGHTVAGGEDVVSIKNHILQRR